jgi:enoyl-CoA hydratase/carnithine racemase
MVGAEAVRVGFATHLVRSGQLRNLIAALEKYSAKIPANRSQAAATVMVQLQDFFGKNIPSKPEMDEWVATYFAGKSSLLEIIESLKQCSIQTPLCKGVFHRLSERSPTALVLSLKLLRHNEGRPLEEVFQTDLKAARFILNHPDFIEGVRARVIDKHDNPQWQPAEIEKVGTLDLTL